MHVLVVEDDRTFSHLLSLHLARHGHQVTIAADGFNGLRVARAERPDLVIMDFRLPDVDGLVVAEWLAESTQIASTPVILLTGAEQDDIESTIPPANVLEVLLKQTLTEETLTASVERVIMSHYSPGQSARAVLFPGETPETSADHRNHSLKAEALEALEALEANRP